MAYADVSDIEARWRALDSDESTRAETLLDDASAMLAGLVAVDDDDEEQAAILKMVSCSMVIRALAASSMDVFGVSNTSMTAGPYTQSFTYSNPSGDMYLTKMEKRLLGITSSYIGTLYAAVDGYYGTNESESE